jgi:aryl-alcohol dehydrogenase-like predicted oxidoreductase
MMTRPLGKTGFSIAPLVFGGNVFGWTIDEKTSFALLDAFVDHGFDAIDTADVYSRWAEGNQGGESETIIGRWLQARPGMRDKVKIFTKVGSDLGLPGHKGLSKAWIQQAVDDSLRRLNTDYIDLYFSHWPDPQTPVAETLEAFHSLQQAGKIRAMGASNLDAMQLAGAGAEPARLGLPAGAAAGIYPLAAAQGRSRLCPRWRRPRRGDRAVASATSVVVSAARRR